MIMRTKTDKDKKYYGKVIAALVIIWVLLILGIGLLISTAVKNIKSGVENTYQTTLEEVTDETAQGYYNWAFEKAEKEHHVSNEVTISIGDMEEMSKLEVLKVRDVEFIIHDGSNDNLKVWTAIPGNGVFTVDMAMSEFLVDDERHVVIARVPEPKLTQCTIDSENIDVYELETGKLLNGNYSQGTERAEEDMKKGQDMIKAELSNQQYLIQAEKSAKAFIADWIRCLNPDVDDLKVEVEFLE